MLGIKNNASGKKDNVPTLLELQTEGVGGEKINNKTSKIITDGDKCFEKWNSFCAYIYISVKIFLFKLSLPLYVLEAIFKLKRI